MTAIYFRIRNTLNLPRRHTMRNTIFTGTIPALMTPCTAERKPDFDALVRKGRELIEAGMSAVVYCGSMGDWPLLTEADWSRSRSSAEVRRGTRLDSSVAFSRRPGAAVR